MGGLDRHQPSGSSGANWSHAGSPGGGEAVARRDLGASRRAAGDEPPYWLPRVQADHQLTLAPILED